MFTENNNNKSLIIIIFTSVILTKTKALRRPLCKDPCDLPKHDYYGNRKQVELHGDGTRLLSAAKRQNCINGDGNTVLPVGRKTQQNSVTTEVCSKAFQTVPLG